MTDETYNTSLRGDDDEMLFELLRTALASLPGPPLPTSETAPDELIDGGVWIHDWLNMDAELAQLTFDSSRDALVGVRSGEEASTGTLRDLTFVGDGLRIEVEVEPGERTVSISGRVSPAVPGCIILYVGGELHRGELDERGGFLIDRVSRGTILAFVELETHNVRLGSFEV